MADLPLTSHISIESTDEPGCINPALYINRELSWIEFDRRVLEEAQDPRNPLLERVKFAAIFHSNLDEFFMVRVSGVKEQIAHGVQHRTPNGFTPVQQFQAIHAQLVPLVFECQQLVCDELLPALHAAGIVIAPFSQLSQANQAALATYFEDDLFPVLTPLVVDPSHRFPFISNLSLNLAVVLETKRGGRQFARVKVPEMLPRLVRVPDDRTDDLQPDTPIYYVWLEEIIAANIGRLFPGAHIVEVHAFRITRDADLEIQEDEAADLLQTMEDNIRRRRFGAVVRVELAASVSDEVRSLLVKNLGVQPEDIYLTGGPLGLKSLMELYDVDRPDLKDAPHVPVTLPALSRGEQIFATIRAGDILLHHPFDAFGPVIELVEAAAKDPQVLAIKQTLYRVGRNSPVVRALMRARDEGKQVSALVELKARFDEENNIEWARALESTGAHVVYGMRNLKVHAKLLLIVRKEADGIRRYVHMATGNYNASTARMYTDFGLLTCDPAIGADVSELFNVLTGASNQTHYRNLLVAPHGLHQALLDKIEREIAHHRREGNGRLIFKCNGLTDQEQVKALYRASQAGVQVDLIVRGICAIRPGIPGLSETLRVRSIVGRFLEHHRLYYFYNGGDEELYLGSADLMDRNLHGRIEQLVLVQDAGAQRYLREVVLDLYLARQRARPQAPGERDLHSSGARWCRTDRRPRTAPTLHRSRTPAQSQALNQELPQLAP